MLQPGNECFPMSFHLQNVHAQQDEHEIVLEAPKQSSNYYASERSGPLSAQTAAIVAQYPGESGHTRRCDSSKHDVFGVCKTTHSAVHVRYLLPVNRKLWKTRTKCSSQTPIFGLPLMLTCSSKCIKTQDPGWPAEISTVSSKS
jgi:hypothetical protein